MNWIFGDYKKDFLWLSLPAVLAVIFAHAFLPAQSSMKFLVFAFVAKGLLDSGHVYTTVWRTYFHKPERERLALYYYLPVALFVMFFSWIYFEWPLLGAVIIYVTLFHNMRQFLGISKWYQKLNSQYDRWSNYFLYALCILPFAVYHFRHLPRTGDMYYSGETAFFYPNYTLENYASRIYWLHVFAWLVHEGISFRKQQEWNRLTSVAVPAVVYGTSFLLTSNEAAVIFPLVISHGASYLALNALAMERTQLIRWGKYSLAVGAVFGTALFFGSLEFIFDDFKGDDSSTLTAGISALILTPLFCHYIYDAFLWKRSHPESSLIYANTLR